MISAHLATQDTFLVPNKVAGENYLTTLQLDLYVPGPIRVREKCFGVQIPIRPGSLHYA